MFEKQNKKENRGTNTLKLKNEERKHNGYYFSQETAIYHDLKQDQKIIIFWH